MSVFLRILVLLWGTFCYHVVANIGGSFRMWVVKLIFHMVGWLLCKVWLLTFVPVEFDDAFGEWIIC